MSEPRQLPESQRKRWRLFRRRPNTIDPTLRDLLKTQHDSLLQELEKVLEKSSHDIPDYFQDDHGDDTGSHVVAKSAGTQTSSTPAAYGACKAQQTEEEGPTAQSKPVYVSSSTQTDLYESERHFIRDSKGVRSLCSSETQTDEGDLNTTTHLISTGEHDNKNEAVTVTGAIKPNPASPSSNSLVKINNTYTSTSHSRLSAKSQKAEWKKVPYKGKYLIVRIPNVSPEIYYNRQTENWRLETEARKKTINARLKKLGVVLPDDDEKPPPSSTTGPFLFGEILTTRFTFNSSGSYYNDSLARDLRNDNPSLPMSSVRVHDALRTTKDNKDCLYCLVRQDGDPPCPSLTSLARSNQSSIFDSVYHIYGSGMNGCKPATGAAEMPTSWLNERKETQKREVWDKTLDLKSIQEALKGLRVNQPRQSDAT